jgi:phage I-like protein
MKPTDPKKEKVTREALVELLEPLLVGAIEEQGIEFTQANARRVLSALAVLGQRYFFLAGGEEKAAATTCLRAIRIARLEADTSQAFSAVTQALADC